jgi:glycosyltransferase involved in cell wall biosynthesis
VLFSDNGSTDNSWKIALEWQKKYPGKMFVARNRANFGTDANIRNCQINKRGEYHLVVGSDDTIASNYISTAVKIMEHYREAAFCLVNRNIMDSQGIIEKEKPFYNQNCIIYPPGQSLIYTVAAVNPSITQVFYRSCLTDAASIPDGSYGAQNYGTRILDFNLSLDYPVVFLRKAFVNHRIHGKNQSLLASDSLDEIIGQHQLSKLFFFKLQEERVEKKLIREYQLKAKNKYGSLSLRYCKREILKGNKQLAKKYLFLAVAYSDINIEKTEEWQKYYGYFMGNVSRNEILNYLDDKYDYQRTTSYDPPVKFYKKLVYE